MPVRAWEFESPREHKRFCFDRNEIPSLRRATSLVHTQWGIGGVRLQNYRNPICEDSNPIKVIYFQNRRRGLCRVIAENCQRRILKNGFQEWIIGFDCLKQFGILGNDEKSDIIFLQEFMGFRLISPFEKEFFCQPVLFFGIICR